MEETINPASFVLMAGTFGASFFALFYLFQKHIGGTPLLTYEPRRRVPWGAGIALVAMLFPFMGILLTLTNPLPAAPQQTIVEEEAAEFVEDDKPADTEDANKFVLNGLSTSVLMITFVVVIGLFLRASVGADNHDLGYSLDRNQFFGDAGIGVLACAAAMLPIMVLQFLLTVFLQPESEHPLIEELQQSHTPVMMLVSLLMVVIAAPLFEEFAFRLLLQGWLEKIEDELMGLTATMRPQPAPAAESDELVDEADREEETMIAFPIQLTPLPREGLPHGWLPILASGTMFGLAHLGHGVSPVPLMLFGFVLGYLYQRTHRLVPSITAHALFNAYSMTMLWLNL